MICSIIFALISLTDLTLVGIFTMLILFTFVGTSEIRDLEDFRGDVGDVEGFTDVGDVEGFTDVGETRLEGFTDVGDVEGFTDVDVDVDVDVGDVDVGEKRLEGFVDVGVGFTDTGDVGETRLLETVVIGVTLAITGITCFNPSLSIYICGFERM